jgi:hypothetical protein
MVVKLGWQPLLLYYNLKLHHLPPSGILHIAAFVTLCEAYMRIEPHFDLWNYFFRVRSLRGSGVEVAVLGPYIALTIFIKAFIKDLIKWLTPS